METTTADKKSAFRFARSHGASVSAAARKAGVTYERAMRWEGFSFCSSCGDYVRDDVCPHWDYEVGQ